MATSEVRVINIGDKELNANNLSIINTWVNKKWVKNSTPRTIYNTYLYLVRRINENYENLESRRAHLTALMNAVSVHSKSLKDKKTAFKRITEISKMATQISHAINDSRAQNQPNDKYISLVQMAQIRNDLIRKYYMKTKDINNHQKLLLSAINTLQPPLRSEDVVNLQFFDKKPVFNPKENYIYKNSGNWNYRIGLQKGRKDKPDRDVKINPELNNLLDYSFKFFPRRYFYQNPINGEQPISTHLYINLIKSTFGDNMDSRGLRHAYGTYYVNQPKSKVNQAKLKEIANDMGTNITTLMTNYTQSIDDDQLKPLSSPNFHLTNPANDIDQVYPSNPKVKTLLDTSKAKKMREYNENHGDKLKEKMKIRRQNPNIIWNDKRKRHILDIKRGKVKTQRVIDEFNLQEYI
jgi:hypothetical protein